ncbi:serine/threonine-protein kinase M1 [Podochytrium sp. JEL0797]|nr:serine/threonine-protein kinase M1 [Podochytrium sp. JEL0797]
MQSVAHLRSNGHPSAAELAALRRTIRSVVDARLELANGTSHSSSSSSSSNTSTTSGNTVMAETTLKLVNCALDSAPTVVFEANGASADAERLVALSQLCATMQQTAPPPRAAAQTKHAAGPALPFGLWILVKLMTILLIESQSPVHDRAARTIRVWFETCAIMPLEGADSEANDTPVAGYDRVMPLLADIATLIKELGSHIAHQTATDISVQLLSSETEKHSDSADAAILTVQFTTYKQCIPAFTNLLKVFRILEESTPMLTIHFTDTLWTASSRVLSCVDANAYPKLTMECYESWIQKIEALGHIPPSLISTLIHQLFDSLHRSLQHRFSLLDDAEEGTDDLDDDMDKSSGASPTLKGKEPAAPSALANIESMELSVEEGMANLLELALADMDALECGGTEEFRTAFSSCSVERIVGGGGFKCIRSLRLKVSCLKVLSYVLRDSVVQRSDLVHQLLEQTCAAELRSGIVECVQIILAQSQAAKQVFDVDVEMNSKRGRNSEPGASSKRVRMNSEGASCSVSHKGPDPPTNLGLLIQAALEMLDLCFKPGDKKLAHIPKLDVICQSLVSTPVYFDEFMSGISASYSTTCGKFCTFITAAVSKAGSSARMTTATLEFELRLICCLAKYISLNDPQWKKDPNLLLRTTAIACSPWFETILAYSAPSSGQVESTAFKELASLLGLLDASLGSLNLVNSSSGGSTLSQRLPCFAVSEDARVECVQSLAKVYGSASMGVGRRYQHCRAVVMMVELNEQDGRGWGQVVEMMGGLNEELWVWIVEQSNLNADSSRARLNASSSQMGKISCALSGTLCNDFTSVEHVVLETNTLSFFKSMKMLLDSLRASGSTDAMESCILSIGHLGRTCCDKLLLSIFYALVILLGDQNIVFQSITFQQMRSIAKVRNKSPYELMLPYLPELSVYLIDRLKIPGLFSNFSKVLTLTQKEFIQRTISYTLPHLIIHKQTDLIQSLANVLNTKVGVLCLHQMSQVLKAIFMLPESYDAISYVLKIAQLEVADSSVDGLIVICALDLVTKLVVELGSPLEMTRKKAKQALISVHESLSGTKTSQAAASDDRFSEFLLSHFLGILSYVNQSLSDQTGRFCLAEKVKIVNGLVSLMALVGNRITALVPQIITTLQTALAIDNLRNVALNGWEVFVGNLGPQQIGGILNQVVGILMKGWKDCSERDAKHIVKIIESIVVAYTQELKGHFNDLCAFPRRPEFAAINAAVDPHRNLDTIGNVKRLLKAVAHDNPIVAESALAELKLLLKKEQAFLHAEILSESVNETISETVSILLETLKKYNGTRIDIQTACCECLGVLGAPDPARLHVTVVSSMDVSLEAFDTKDTTDAFVCKFIEKQLAPAFRSATNPHSQALLAFAIQELLRFCGFTSEFQEMGPRNDRAKKVAGVNEDNAKLVALWQNFPRPVLDVIRPLLSTKYSIETRPQRSFTSPIYRTANGFNDWLQFWVVDLMRKATGKYANRILSVCTQAVESENIGIGIYLLPRLVLNILTGGSQAHSNELLAEFTAVLNDVIVPNGSANIEKQQLSSQTIFQLIDHLTVWIRSRRRDLGRTKAMQRRSIGRHANPDDEDDQDTVRQRVASFLSGIPPVLMATASYRCKSYARALLHYEQHIRNEKKTKNEREMQPAYGFLQEIYAQLEEPDGIDGISTLFLNPTLDQQIREHESAGRWTSAQTCYEISLQTNPDEVRLHTGLINCLKNLGHLGSMLTHINGITATHPAWSAQLNQHGIEAAWRLGSWDTLDTLLAKDHQSSFETDVGGILLHAKQPKFEAFTATLRRTREQLIAPLAAASMESYSRAYDCIVKLNMLHEVEAACQHIWTEEEVGSVEENEGFLANVMLKSWDTRLKITMPSLKVREPILNLRRILIRDLGPDAALENAKIECGHIWLQTAKALRAAGHYQPAYSAIVHATELQTPNATLQRAKWLSETNQPHRAIFELKSLIDRYYSTSASTNGRAPPESIMALKAKTLLMFARKMDETSMGTSESMFSMVTLADPSWEKGFFFLGRYFNKILEREVAHQQKLEASSKSAGSKSNIQAPRPSLPELHALYHVCKNYLLALHLGTRYIYQTLPRLLTLWMSLGEMNAKMVVQDKDSQHRKYFGRISRELKKLIEKMPAYQFLPAVPQLISRICHNYKPVHEILELLLSTVLAYYPQQTLWNLLSVSKSKYPVRAKRCVEILDKVQEGRLLCDELLKLCNYPIMGKESTLNMARDFPVLKRMTNLNMIIPIQKTLTVTLPSDGKASTLMHQPFPFDPPTIKEFYNEIEVMNSLQKPRKITILGSDGKDYIFLLKPKDDLRKDARLMEFNGLINKLLKKDPEARRRNLRVRTYAVVPLNEECGIIEWVENTVGFRNIVTKSYRAKGLYFPPQEVKDLLDPKPNGPDPAVVFTQQVIPRFPPVFHEWFLETFPEPTKWFASRLSYSGTVAVMSMVGYVVGLGDRHGENILFDELSGDCVHVDLNCLFDKGMTFEKPEKVPFRLTHNMVDAFGITGTEGVFRKACEASLRVLRTNRESLLAVLETFIHDPLCEWSRRTSSTHANAARTSALMTGDVENEEAVKHLTRIETKLKGIPRQGLLPLSIEGQVQELIAEATDPKNLSAMYIGWAPFL